MRKMLVIAVREYNAAVRTKTFVISLLLMPLLMGGSVAVQALLKDVVDVRDKRFAVVDRTPGQEVWKLLKAAADTYNEKAVYDEGGKKQVKPRFVLELVVARGTDPADVDQQRFELSEEVRKGKYVGFVDARGGHLYTFTSPPNAKEKAGPQVELRYQSNRLMYMDFARFADGVVTKAIQTSLGTQKNLQKWEQDVLLQPVKLNTKGLSQRDPETGEVRDASEGSQAASFIVPFALMLLMFMTVLMCATPLMQGVVEEKMQRIAEVLLGSVRPFELMMGKLLGMTAVSLTIVAVYLAGMLWAAHQFDVTEYLTVDLLLWFLLFQALAALMFGSLFIAIGAACTDMKETQNLMWPVMLLAMTPMFLLGNVLREPNSPVATSMSFFPFATPTLMITRMAVPPGIPLWQPVVGVLIVLATTVLCVYAAGRIFRVGILMQGKGAKLSEMMRWVFRG
jgi:ABC-type Na+ efflux pump permease subunit